MRIELDSLLLCRDAEVQRTMRLVLDELGIGLEVVRQAGEANDLLQRRKFDAVIVDCDDIQGSHALLRSLRQGNSNKTAVVFTIVDQLTSVQGAYDLGANFVLDKPLSSDSALRCFRAAHGLLVRERRRYFRHAATFQATLSSAFGKLPVKVINISEGGMAVHARRPIPIAGIVDLSFVLPESATPIVTLAEIAWSLPDGRAGLRFQFLDERSRKELERWTEEAFEALDSGRLFIDASRKSARA